MKTLILQIVFCFLFSYMLKAIPVVEQPLDIITLVQDTIDDEDDDEFTISIGRHREDDDFLSNNLRIGMLDFGISTYVDKNGNIDMPDDLAFMDQVLWRSMNIGLHLVNIKVGFGENLKPGKIGLSTGLKINWTHYSLEQDYKLERNQPTYQEAINYEVPELKKNRLRGTYLQIPFLLEFNSNPRSYHKSLNLGIGYVHQFLLGSQYKYKTREDKIKEKTRGDFNLRKSMGLVEGRLGVGHLNFFVQYGLKNLFQENNGPELTPINFGVNIIPR